MNYDLLNKKMSEFFKETTAAELIKEFEKIGYTFVDSGIVKWKDIKCKPFAVNHLHFYRREQVKHSFWRKSKIEKKEILLSSNYSPEELRGLFLFKIA